MRNAAIRRKHARAERLWVRFMTQAPRLIVPDYREVNWAAAKEHQALTIPGAETKVRRLNEAGEGCVEL